MTHASSYFRGLLLLKLFQFLTPRRTFVLCFATSSNENVALGASLFGGALVSGDFIHPPLSIPGATGCRNSATESVVPASCTMRGRTRYHALLWVASCHHRGYSNMRKAANFIMPCVHDSVQLVHTVQADASSPSYS